MGISSCISALFSDGRVRVASDAALPDAELRRLDELLTTFERQYADHLPGTPPAFSLPAARYGAVVLYRFCQFLVFRNLDAEAIQRSLPERPDAALSPSVHYSVDLALRFLPDVARLASGMASGDPLLTILRQLANQWPLSSVGIPGLSEAQVDSWIDDACLRRLYADRIVARQDWSRLGDERVRADVTAALGAFPELAPDVAKVLDGSVPAPSTNSELAP